MCAVSRRANNRANEVSEFVSPWSEYESDILRGLESGSARSIARSRCSEEKSLQGQRVIGKEGLTCNYQLVFSCFLVIISLFF